MTFINRYMSKGTAYILSLIAGILIAINGVVNLALPGFLLMIPGIGDVLGLVTAIMTVMGVVGIILGIILIYGSFMVKKGKKNWGIIVLILSIISFITVSGFFVGSILGIIGGILAIKAKK